MNDFTQIISNLSKEVYENLKQAIELGKWQDGRKVRPEQLELCMQAVIIWENAQLQPEQRTGYIQDKCKSHSVQNGVNIKNLH